MRSGKFSMGWMAILASCALTLLATSSWAADWNEKVLHRFCSQPSCSDGNGPRAALISDAAGNLYGTTDIGGANNAGTVFELARNGSGGWRETVLYNFCSQPNCTDGANSVAGLIFDAAGDLYGTTEGGGVYSGGTVFELTPIGGGDWAETVLYSFCSQANCADGYEPLAGVIFDAAGNLYGTTVVGGSSEYGGTVFELAPTAGGTWTESVLHSFCSPPNCNDGYWPYGGVIFDDAGNLYGTTNVGGNNGGGGTVFELTPTGSGRWTEALLYSFCNPGQGYCTTGADPVAGLIFDDAGNLYGTTSAGGNYAYYCIGLGCGTVFELTPAGSGGWTKNVLYSFCSQSNCTDGAAPVAGLIFDTVGNLYSTTSTGGTYGGGMVFELAPTAGGGWIERVLHSFNNNGWGGSGPQAGVIFDSIGNLYGTINGGGGRGGPGGTVFELTPLYPCVVCSHAVHQ